MRAIQIVEPRKIAMLDDASNPEPAEGVVLRAMTRTDGVIGKSFMITESSSKARPV